MKQAEYSACLVCLFSLFGGQTYAPHTHCALVLKDGKPDPFVTRTLCCMQTEQVCSRRPSPLLGTAHHPCPNCFNASKDGLMKALSFLMPSHLSSNPGALCLWKCWLRFPMRAPCIRGTTLLSSMPGLALLLSKPGRSTSTSPTSCLISSGAGHGSWLPML